MLLFLMPLSNEHYALDVPGFITASDATIGPSPAQRPLAVLGHAPSRTFHTTYSHTYSL